MITIGMAVGVLVVIWLRFRPRFGGGCDGCGGAKDLSVEGFQVPPAETVVGGAGGGDATALLQTRCATLNAQIAAAQEAISKGNLPTMHQSLIEQYNALKQKFNCAGLPPPAEPIAIGLAAEIAPIPPGTKIPVAAPAGTPAPT